MTTKGRRPEAEEPTSAWETELGLPDDLDAWITNPRFGFKDEYAQAVLATGAEGGAMILFDLVDEDENLIGSQGYSIGTGWEISDDGRHITHPKRKNVVTATMYGQLQNKVVKDLGVKMDQYGVPTDAMAWDRLGFHWNQLPHTTVSGQERTALMPTQFLGRKGEGAVPATAKAAPATKPAPAAKVSRARIEAFKLVAGCSSAKEFMMKAVKNPAIVSDDVLMAECMDDSDNGFFAQNKV